MQPALPPAAAARCCALALPLLLANGAVAQTPGLYDPDTIRELRLTFAQPNWWQQMVANRRSDTPIAADLAVDGIHYRDVGVRFRGNTSWLLLPPGSQKASFDVQLDWLVPGQDLLGYDRLNLNNGWHDPTFLREFLGYLLMRRHGLAPQCNFVRLVINGQPWGLYINVQQPNKDFVAQGFGTGDGSRYRGFPTSGGFSDGRCALTWLGADPALYLSAYQAKRGDGVDLAQLCLLLATTPVAQLPVALPPLWNVDAFFRYAAVMNAIANQDSYVGSGKEHWLLRDAHHGDFHIVPFDLNEALNSNPALDPWYNATLPTLPALSRPLQVPAWRARYVAHLRHVVATSLEPGWLVPVIRHYHSLIAADVAADPRKLYSTAAFFGNLDAPVTIDGGYGPLPVPGLVPFVQTRAAFLAAHADLAGPAPSLAAPTVAPVAPDPSQSVAVAIDAGGGAIAVNLHWRRQGPFRRTPMFDDGRHGDGVAGDGRFGALVPPQPAGSRVDWFVEATDAAGRATLLPPNAEGGAHQWHVAWPWSVFPVAINEFVAQNTSGIVDENGQHEDWVELLNTSGSAIDVGGAWLSDTVAAPKYQLPANTWIPAHGTLLVWCDDDPPGGELHANFKLAAAGEDLVLFAADGRSVHDRFSFGPQTANVATGRLRGGDGPWVTFPLPTPRAPNAPAGCGSLAFGALAAGLHIAVLQVTAVPRLGAHLPLDLTRGPPAGAGLWALGLAPAHLPVAPFGPPGEVLLLDPAAAAILAAAPLDPIGHAVATLTIPAATWLVGTSVFGQAFTLAPGRADSSNAVQLVVCP